MSRVIRLNVVEQKVLSNPEAAILLKDVIERIKSKEGSISPFLAKTLNYLSKHSKLKEDVGVEAVKSFLKGLGYKDETIVMIINLCPKTVDDLRILLDYEERYVEESVLNETVEYMKNVCL
ncbi:MAG: DNA-directed RNA polymerase subunit F [Thermogladius sp.]|uniref:DNA-directed RNA polymerase subunit F n=1 Tax=Thermogladius sp. TaxID=2023064 RepID=UPI003D0B78B7